jgi:hypothetical protein
MDMNSSNTNSRHTIYQTSRKQEPGQQRSGMVVGLPQIGQLRRVDPQAYWGEEPTKYVAWLAQEDVINLLGQALSLDLQIYDQVRQQITVNADIVCNDVISEHLVLISNQLEEANHKQMGKVLADVACLDGGIYLLISGGFPEEQLTVLDWLNAKTSESFSFYGLEIEFWQIGDSPLAPKFNIVCQPNDAIFPISDQLPSLEQVQEQPRDVQLEFWSDFRNFIEEQGTFLKVRKQYPSGWMDFALGRSDFWLSVVMNNHEQHIGVALVIAGSKSKQKYQRLHENMSRIETELGVELEWDFKKDREFNFIYRHRPDSDPTNRTTWTEQFKWLLHTLELFHSVFSPRVQLMETTDYFVSD